MAGVRTAISDRVILFTNFYAAFTNSLPVRTPKRCSYDIDLNIGGKMPRWLRSELEIQMLNLPTKNAASSRYERKALPAATILVVLVLSLGLGIAFGQNAQGQAAPDQSGQASGMDGHMGRRGMPSVDDQVKHMAKKLNLSDDQQAKLKPILEDQRKQMEQIRDDSSLSREDRFSKMKSVHESSAAQIKALLNDDQQKKFEKMQEERREHMGGRGPGSGPPGNAPSQPQ
jgi:periplasmic protein CpxP/Spy